MTWWRPSGGLAGTEMPPAAAMKKEYSPFTPGIPVPSEFFVGRTEEIQKLVSSTRKALDLKTIERLFTTLLYYVFFWLQAGARPPRA